DTERRGRVQGVAVTTQAPRVSHLLFADDTLILCWAKEEQIDKIKRILATYERVSDQMVNFEKSSMVVSGCVQVEMNRQLTIAMIDSHDRYLGFVWGSSGDSHDCYLGLSTIAG
ncbi:UNVERIFIED_CONTAM: hypothetical protein Sradi_5684200, partial [Sesamum radiatum]